MPLDTQRALKPLRKLRKALAHPSRCLNPEGVHEIRTQCYRVESMARALAFYSGQKPAKVVEAIEPIRKRAGKARDMDVLTSLAATLPDSSGSEPLIQLMEELGARHERFAGKLEQTLLSRRRKARRELKLCHGRVKKELTASRSAAADAWRRDATARTLELSTELAKWPGLQAENLHSFRLKVKELRYVLQLSSDADRQLVDALGDVKDAIGEWHDWTELAALTAKVVGDKGRSSLSKDIGALVQKKFHHALTLAEHLRRCYFDVPETRCSGRTPRHVKIKEPVLATAARMAA